MTSDQETKKRARDQYITDEHRMEAERLRKLWRATQDIRDSRGVGSQSAFGAAFDIGTQAAVWQFMNAHTVLSLRAARGFAQGFRCSIQDFSPRLAKEAESIGAAVSYLPEFVTKMSSPITRQSVTVVPHLTWTELLTMPDLPDLFNVECHDDAMAPRAPAGCSLTFSSVATPRYGDGVLVRDKRRQLYFREYRQGDGDAWVACATNPAYRDLHSITDGLQLVAVLMGGGPRWT